MSGESAADRHFRHVQPLGGLLDRQRAAGLDELLHLCKAQGPGLGAGGLSHVLVPLVHKPEYRASKMLFQKHLAQINVIEITFTPMRHRPCTAACTTIGDKDMPLACLPLTRRLRAPAPFTP